MNVVLLCFWKPRKNSEKGIRVVRFFCMFFFVCLLMPAHNIMLSESNEIGTDQKTRKPTSCPGHSGTLPWVVFFLAFFFFGGGGSLLMHWNCILFAMLLSWTTMECDTHWPAAHGEEDTPRQEASESRWLRQSSHVEAMLKPCCHVAFQHRS